MRAIAVIPARHASSRFPGKPLCILLGKPMIEWVVEVAKKAESLDQVCVATDHEDIAAAARRAGAIAVMTSPECTSGTDRVAEVAREIEADVYVNVQGDEPTLDHRDLDHLVKVFSEENPPEIATLARPAHSYDEVVSPDVVKVVRDQRGDALYFSRAPIPHYRDLDDARGEHDYIETYVHVGVYAYTREALLDFTSMREGGLEAAEKLEQLRALEAGMRIRVLDTVGEPSMGVDKPEDVRKVEELLSRRNAAK